jgi:hypothetical protein
MNLCFLLQQFGLNKSKMRPTKITEEEEWILPRYTEPLLLTFESLPVKTHFLGSSFSWDTTFKMRLHEQNIPLNLNFQPGTA